MRWFLLGWTRVHSSDRVGEGSFALGICGFDELDILILRAEAGVEDVNGVIVAALRIRLNDDGGIWEEDAGRIVGAGAPIAECAVEFME